MFPCSLLVFCFLPCSLRKSLRSLEVYRHVFQTDSQYLKLKMCEVLPEAKEHGGRVEVLQDSTGKAMSRDKI